MYILQSTKKYSYALQPIESNYSKSIEFKFGIHIIDIHNIGIHWYTYLGCFFLQEYKI